MAYVQVPVLSGRQRRELEYHRQHAEKHRRLLDQPFSFEVLDRPERRWWNAYWSMYALLSKEDLVGKKILVVGCGFGDDALRLAKLGAEVSAFDLCGESLSIARQLAKREALEIQFEQMAAELLRYPSNTFDYVVARDILHHVDIPKAMVQLRRVAKPGAIFVMNEIYSHSMTDRIRNCNFVAKRLYPMMQDFIYGKGNAYITEDERKLSEADLEFIQRSLKPADSTQHFNFLVTRIVPDRFEIFAKLDQLAMRMLRRFAPLLAGRVLFAAEFRKQVDPVGQSW